MARTFGVGWATAHQCVIDYGDAAIAADDRLDGVTGLGVDEHTFAHSASDGGTKMATTFVDLARGRLLDVTRGRSGEVVREWVGSHGSNGPTEAVDLLVEKIRRIGHGYRNFTNYRRRLRLGCGITWTTLPVRRIRGRHTATAA